jgi:radical SAM protein with 4Fe4S-binding SPASM domain
MLRQFISGINVLSKPLTVKSRPIHLQVETTTYCNLKCQSCPRDFVVKKPKHIDIRLFKSVVDEVMPHQILINGIGEPLTNPEIVEIIRYLKRLGILVNLVTNGTMLDNAAKDLVSSGLDTLSVSVDASTAPTYHKVRGQDVFDRVLLGIEKIVKLKKAQSSPKPYIRTNFVLQSANIPEAAGFVKLSKKLGVDAVYFQPLSIACELSLRRQILVGNLNYGNFLEALHQIKLESSKQRIPTNVDYILRKSTIFWSHYTGAMMDKSVCIFPWFSSYINIDGDVQACCAFGVQGKVGILGNIAKSGKFMDIWNKEPYREFRRNLATGSRPYQICQECIPRTLKDLFDLSRLLPGVLKPLR